MVPYLLPHWANRTRNPLTMSVRGEIRLPVRGGRPGVYRRRENGSVLAEDESQRGGVVGAGVDRQAGELQGHPHRRRAFTCE